jgi:hypothetical protein
MKKAIFPQNSPNSPQKQRFSSLPSSSIYDKILLMGGKPPLQQSVNVSPRFEGEFTAKWYRLIMLGQCAVYHFGTQHMVKLLYNILGENYGKAKKSIGSIKISI